MINSRFISFSFIVDDNVELSSSDDELINKMVNISSFTQGEGVLHSFPCSEIKDDFYMPRYLSSV